MTATPPPEMLQPTPEQQKLAAALRANLLKRKQQAQGRELGRGQNKPTVAEQAR